MTITSPENCKVSSISIHTPTNGVTLYLNIFVRFCQISIHTPTKGVTLTSWSAAERLVYFNPHSHEGSDQFATLYISSVQNFNPHSHEGSDLNIQFIFFAKIKFQSTLPRREWLLIYDLAVCYCYISIHTPTKGVTALICTPSSTYKNFNPHSHEGSDHTPLLITYWG